MTKPALLSAALVTLLAQNLPLESVRGVATTLRRAPSGRETFVVSASAGRTLLVELNVDKAQLADGASEDRCHPKTVELRYPFLNRMRIRIG